MITIATDLGPARIVEKLDELPDPTNWKRIYADVETTSFDPHVAGVHPYMGHRACGWAVTADNVEGAWYVPIRHYHKHWNLPVDNVLLWLKDVLSRPDTVWTNHNIKFDAHFAYVDGVEFGGELDCTLTRAKLHNSDRWSHDLKGLCRDWCRLPMGEEVEVKNYLAGIKLPNRKKCKDYGRVPADILGRYACMDVIGNRVLSDWLEDQLHESQAEVAGIERNLTPVLWDMEKNGLKVNERAVLLEGKKCLQTMIDCEQTVWDEIGCDLTDSNKAMYDIFINQLGLPVLAWNVQDDGTRKASFDKDAMLLYSNHPLVQSDDKRKRVVDAITTFRHDSQFMKLFVAGMTNLRDEGGRIHPMYNQAVRTGRMSGHDPNAQQFNTRAKALILADDGCTIVSNDASQAELRMIAHITKDWKTIKEYTTNPDVDYHALTAERIGVKRKAAKTVNFAISFGATDGRITEQLMGDKDIIAEAMEVCKTPEEVERFCRQKAEDIVRTYHLEYPGIRSTSQKAKRLCRRRGYIKNPYGRRRHLPPRQARKAFNTAVQGGTMDMIKDRMNETSERYWEKMQAVGGRIAANVHDEVMHMVPTEECTPEFLASLDARLSSPSKEFRLPFAWDQGTSEKHWAEAKG